MKRHEKPLPPRPPSPSDVWEKATLEKCARAIAHWLKGSVNTKRPINTLKLPELEAMAQNVLSTWIVEMSQRVETAPTKEEKDRIAAILC